MIHESVWLVTISYWVTTLLWLSYRLLKAILQFQYQQQYKANHFFVEMSCYKMHEVDDDMKNVIKKEADHGRHSSHY